MHLWILKWNEFKQVDIGWLGHFRIFCRFHGTLIQIFQTLILKKRFNQLHALISVFNSLLNYNPRRNIWNKMQKSSITGVYTFIRLLSLYNLPCNLNNNLFISRRHFVSIRFIKQDPIENMQTDQNLSQLTH